MKNLLGVLCVLLVSCSNSNSLASNDLAVFRGTVVGIPYFVKDGGQASTVGVDLESPILVDGFPKPITRVVLLVPMKQLRAWGPEIIGKQMVATCSRDSLTQWTPKQVGCSPNKIDLGSWVPSKVGCLPDKIPLDPRAPKHVGCPPN